VSNAIGWGGAWPSALVCGSWWTDRARHARLDRRESLGVERRSRETRSRSRGRLSAALSERAERTRISHSATASARLERSESLDGKRRQKGAVSERPEGLSPHRIDRDCGRCWRAGRGRSPRETENGHERIKRHRSDQKDPTDAEFTHSRDSGASPSISDSSANSSRRSFLENFPVAVLGTSSMNSTASGTHQSG